MKCTIPEISWHNREPVLSVDIHPISNDCYKLASGGGDSHILIWQMVLCENGSVNQEVISDLTRHQKSVNTVRWSSTGQYLASADDDANIIVWQLKTDSIPLLEGESDDKEVWNVHKILRGHKEDIYDLCWSTDNFKLLSGSVDNTAIVWDLAKGKLDQIMSDHKGFVQGVAWDPKNQLLATVSTDRVCRLYDNTGKQVRARIHKGKLPVPEDHFLYEKESKYFHDDTFKSFYRRLQFTPDGSLLIVPSGHFQADDCKKILNSTLVFTMDNWTEPAAILPLEQQSSTVVRCCPILFQHRDEGPDPLVQLPYRIIFAVGTDHDIILYDTQQSKPFARFHEIHYTRITDLTWSRDGLLLIASSTDGFCSLITFEPEELGQEYVKEESDEEINSLDVSENIESIEKDENIDITNKVVNEKEEVKKRPSFIQNWAQSTPKKVKLEKGDKETNGERPAEKINVLIPRRKTPQKVEGNKNKVDEIIEISGEQNDKPGNSAKELKIVIERLSVSNPRRITPKKIGECSRNNNQAKPIEVRRKPREFEAPKDDLAAKPIGHECGEATQLIPVRRKLIEDTDNTGNGVLAKGDSETNKTGTEELKNEDGVVIIEDAIVLDDDNQDNVSFNEGKNGKIDITGSKETVMGNKKVIDGKKKKNIGKKADPTPKIKKKDEKSSNTPPKISESGKESTNSGKPKIKVGSLVRKKLNTTPVKSNALLDFLQKSGGKNKKSKTEPAVKECINLTLEEGEEAMDGFSEKTAQKDKTSSPNGVSAEEDCTEDFCLQLEETQDGATGKKTSNEVAADDEQSSIVINISDDSCSPMKKIEENAVQKKPRRVPLITLSSPKGKKRSEPEKLET